MSLIYHQSFCNSFIKMFVGFNGDKEQKSALTVQCFALHMVGNTTVDISN